MSKNRKLVRVIKNFYQQFQPKSPSTVKEESLWLLRSFIVTKKRPDWVNAGFVLPTVAMVSLVVVLLTIAILFRSFERSKNASNVRVNQAVLNAAMPAIDRAKVKIDKIFADPTLPRSTPSDGALYNALTKNLSKYTFGDENPLEIKYDIDGNNSIKADADELENRESTRTAWRFPVDTDNNGKFDSFTVYGIFFRTPSRDNDGNINRARTPLDSRTRPMSDGNLGGPCSAGTGTSASLIGDSGWYSSVGVIKKSFFVYAATVPITDAQAVSRYGQDFEEYKGNRGFSAVEYQQDKERIPLNSNAVVYEDDLEITPGGGLNLNGRIFTNSNLITGRIYDPIRLYQVSSPKSCFYQPQKSKIIVGGNIGYGRVNGTSARGGTEIHLYKENPDNSSAKKYIDSKTRNVNNNAGDIAFNSQAYAQRINLLVEKQTGSNPINYSQDPTEVQENIKLKLADNPGLDVAEVRREELENYFRKRTRKVPFAEVGLGESPGIPILQDRGKDTLRAQDQWIYPFNPTNNSTSYTDLKLYLARLEATEPNMLAEIFKEYEQYIGDRIVIGNNLPALWFDKNIKDFVGNKAPQDVLPKTAWTKWADEEFKYRYRTTQINQEISLNDASKRDRLFEVKASERPDTPLDNVGGMRVVTGAGIYVDGVNYRRGSGQVSFLPEPQWDRNFVNPTNVTRRTGKEKDLWFNGKQPIVVWPDSMPMSNTNGQPGQGDLVMRATAVYHYAKSSGIEQVPIACVSSYYDPTNKDTAQNRSGLTKVPDSIGADSRTTLGKSNNGIVYKAPYTSNGARRSAMTRLSAQLELQARLVFPNGRFVNEPLRDALDSRRRGQTLTMAENSAVDTAICAIEIQRGRLGRERSLIPDGAIYEASFLDARQVKAIENTPDLSGADPDYSLDLEQRQPLEVRVTVLDLEKLRRQKISGGLRQEYLIPNSGIIYATRDDALLDLSDSSDNIDTQKLLSPTDYLVDSTRRANGIMLINGKQIHRELNFREEEKGLILATNVPAYIKGDLNLHAKGGNVNSPVEEFTLRLIDRQGNINWGNFYKRTTTDKNFACRKGDPRLPDCTAGDSWRPATVVADAVTVLSNNYRFGFRSEGDYDLRNNSGNRVVLNYDFNGNGNSADILDETAIGVDLNGDGDTTDRSVSEANQISASAVRRHLGFFENNYLTSAEWFDTNTNIDSPKNDFDSIRTGNQAGSSYVNNFVTPIQRRVKFGEYVMEICRKIPVETCEADDWVVQGNTKAGEIAIGTAVSTLESGTTAALATNLDDRRFPRRVAFLRDPNTNKLILDERGAPVPIGIDSAGKLKYYPYRELKLPFDKTAKKFDPASSTIETFSAFSSSNRPRIRDRALWFQTAGDTSFSNNPPRNENYGKAEPLFFMNRLIKGSTITASGANYSEGNLEQPLLVPILQIHMPNDRWTRSTGEPGDNRTTLPNDIDRGIAIDRDWLPEATITTTNVTIAAGDTPARDTESNGGLENFVRYLEKWEAQSKINHILSGSLIQYKRSAYATAPWQVIQRNGNNAGNGSIFNFRPYYRTNTTGGPRRGEGMTPFYTAPSRQWGFDVALLPQTPDLFAQQFTTPPSNQPKEFFREVSKDDDWVKTLLCAKTLRIDNNNRVSLDGNNAVPDNQRPTDFCKANTGG